MLSMKRDEFLSELERLLSGLPQQEQEETMQYYRDYFDDAGPEHETEALRELGSPRKVAAAVMVQFEEEDGECTEKGFANPRWEEPPKEVIVVEDREDRQRKWIKIGIAAFFVLFILPGILRIIGKLFGFSLNFALAVVVLLIGIGVCTVVSMIAGVAGVVVGFFLLFWMPMRGLMVLGLGFTLLGIGFLGNVLSMRFYGKWLPALLHAASEQVGKLSRKRRGGAEE